MIPHVTFHSRAKLKAVHQTIDPATSTQSFIEQHAAKTAPQRAGLFAWVSVFLAGLIMGASAMSIYYQERIALEHEWDKKGGLIHLDPTGQEWWDYKINGARGTNGMGEYK